MLKGPINEKNTTTSIPNYIPTTVYMYNGYQILSGLSLVSLHPLGTPWWRVQAQVIILTKWVFFWRMNKKWWVSSTRSTPHLGGATQWDECRILVGMHIGWNLEQGQAWKNTNVFFYEELYDADGLYDPWHAFFLRCPDGGCKCGNYSRWVSIKNRHENSGSCYLFRRAQVPDGVKTQIK